MSTEADIVDPCPFCAGKAVHGYDGPLDGSGVYPIIFCTVCGAKTGKCPTFGVAIVRWNSRAERDAAEQAVLAAEAEGRATARASYLTGAGAAFKEAADMLSEAGLETLARHFLARSTVAPTLLATTCATPSEGQS